MASFLTKIRKSKAPLGVQLSALYWVILTVWSLAVLGLLLLSPKTLPGGSEFLVGFTNLRDLVSLEGVKIYLAIFVALGAAFNLYTAYQLLIMHLRGFWYSVIAIALSLVQSFYSISQHQAPKTSFEWTALGAQVAILVYLVGHKKIFK